MNFKINIYRFLIFLLLLFPVHGIASAQGGSNYSLFGIGDFQTSINANYDGLAGTSIAEPSDHEINLTNPALWSKVTTTRLSAGYRFNQNSLTTNNQTLWQNNGSIDGVLGLFSIDTTLGLTASFGIYPYTHVNYLIRTPVKVMLDDLEVDGDTYYQGKGGLSLAYIGGSINILKNLSVGASIFALFGTIQTSMTTNIYGADYYVSSSELSDNFSGYGYRVGLYYSLFDDVNFGAFIAGHPSLTASRSSDYASGYPGTTDTIISYSDISINLPTSMGLGLSYKLGNFMFGGDYSTQDFSNFSYNPGPKTEYRKSSQMSFGMSILGSKRLGASLAEKINYNFGFGYRQLYYIINGIDINETYASFGMNIPLVTLGTSYLDAAITIGSRGTQNNGLIKEMFGRLTIDMSIGEVWFKPYKRDQ
ncbi:MAG: hypothetical protein ABSG15_12015 [FCB group bacterium]|jgi:hypothetical protein